MRFHLHPDSDRLFEVLSAGLETGEWTEFHVAVAWARESAVRLLNPVLTQFLTTGGRFRITVGVGLQGTSREALEGLMALEGAGDAEVFVYNNEASEETFHPKIYVFRNSNKSRLVVGSSNLTDGGLATNVEASLDVDSVNDAPVVLDVVRSLEGLRNLTDTRVRRLEPQLLTDLVAGGYVVSEGEIRTRRAASQHGNRGSSGRVGSRLFGTVHRPRPARSARTAAAPSPIQVLLLRPRRASERARRTQVQIPITLVRSPFLANVIGLRSAHDNRVHPLGRARARGALNTIKVEFPEIAAIDDPVIRLTKTGTDVVYEAFSADSTLGKPISDALHGGLGTQPPLTVATIRDISRATLYRFV